ncbi:phenylacetic acid degradation operon negative regulatory protein [Saccharothrix tamanrassetensis]|uniref:Phenylacetic acid degradation operon negative regulatory protein n=1 Tax=Saccharothrix tamanrassetensis TaxID=1051531 RepID=A0A841CAK7_9PSEU|nr:PaaX family transcriptional regulator C-terminal domain-containing protein [Saccharothrix tamanrassetensis]MBB5954231.1 phenylacetic acid degradation operon negative regulatory protein [Saccharothrix tamanrassetensis]
MDVEVPTRTVVEALVRVDGTVEAGELYEVADALGMSDQQVRLCVKRLVAEGKFTVDGRGRRAVLKMTPQARRAAEPDVEFVRFMYRQDAGEAQWDGVWHLVAFAVPESQRPARDALRDAIVRFGGAPLHGGLYVSPHDWEDLVEGEATHLGVLPSVTFLTSADLRIGRERSPAALASRLWPLDEVAARHERLAEVARVRLRRLTEGASRTDLLRIAVELAAEFTRAVEPDPLLPPVLLPQPWIGTQARALVARCWDALGTRSAELPALFRMYHDAVEVLR